MMLHSRTLHRLYEIPKFRERYEPAADNGFFGPGSVTWKVWSYPSSIIIGFTRAVTIEQLDPNLNAAVEQSGGVRNRTRSRYERTMRYFAMVAFGDTRTATQAADILVKVHSKAVGVDPVTGARFDANAPASQLWILVTAWHSILYTYEKLGPGRLSADEERQYWAECARAAECQTIDPAAVPRNREEVRAFFAQWRPHLAASEQAQSMTEYILRTRFVFPEWFPRWTRPLQAAAGHLFGRMVISTYPRYIRHLFGLRQSRLTDAVVTAVARLTLRIIGSSPWLATRLTAVVAPGTAEIVGPVLLEIPARSATTMTPRAAQRAYGYDLPAEAHLALRQRQLRRVLDAGQAPSEEGLVESEPLFGGLAARNR